MLSDWPLLSLVTFLPLVGALMILLTRGDEAVVARNARFVALWTSLVTFLISLLVWANFDNRDAGFQMVESVTWIASGQIGYKMGVDGISLFFVLLSTLLTPICILSAWDAVQVRVKEYMIAFLVLETLMVGMFCALDILVLHLLRRRPDPDVPDHRGVGRAAARLRGVQVFPLHVGRLGADAAGHLDHVLSGWHNRYPDLDASRSFWSGIANLAVAGVFRLLRGQGADVAGAYLVAGRPCRGPHRRLGDSRRGPAENGRLRVFALFHPDVPTGLGRFRAAGVRAVGGGRIYTSLVALAQADMKKLIAYSSVAHMGFVTIGAFTMTEQGVQGSIFQMLSHGVVSGALFLCVGVVYDRIHSREIADYGGLVHRMPRYALFFMLFMLASVGLPGTSGFVGEFLVLMAAFEVSTWLAVLATSGVVLGATYMLWLYRRVVFGVLDKENLKNILDLSPREIAIFAPLIALVLWMGIYPTPFLDAMAASVEQLVANYQTALVNAGVAVASR